MRKQGNVKWVKERWLWKVLYLHNPVFLQKLMINKYRGSALRHLHTSHVSFSAVHMSLFKFQKLNLITPRIYIYIYIWGWWICLCVFAPVYHHFFMVNTKRKSIAYLLPSIMYNFDRKEFFSCNDFQIDIFFNSDIFYLFIFVLIFCFIFLFVFRYFFSFKCSNFSRNKCDFYL